MNKYIFVKLRTRNLEYWIKFCCWDWCNPELISQFLQKILPQGFWENWSLSCGWSLGEHSSVFFDMKLFNSERVKFAGSSGKIAGLYSLRRKKVDWIFVTLNQYLGQNKTQKWKKNSEFAGWNFIFFWTLRLNSAQRKLPFKETDFYLLSYCLRNIILEKWSGFESN